MENVGSRQDQKQRCEKNTGHSEMDHGKPKGQQKEKTDKQHGNQMGQSFVLHPGNLLVMVGEKLRELFLSRLRLQQLRYVLFVLFDVVNHNDPSISYS